MDGRGREGRGKERVVKKKGKDEEERESGMGEEKRKGEEENVIR